MTENHHEPRTGGGSAEAGLLCGASHNATPQRQSGAERLAGGSAELDPVILFVQPESIYKSFELDCYDESRDARTYAGNSPVVAHPPCQLWGKMANVNYARWGGEHNKPGNDGGCFRFALDTVNRCGGVLEHPAETYAWPAHGLPRPTTGWTRCEQGWVCEVWQSAYGHRANKRTWLYCSGTDAPLHPRWERPTGTHQVGFHDQRGKSRNKPTLSKREANATPPLFAAFLIELARACRICSGGAERAGSQASDDSTAKPHNARSAAARDNTQPHETDGNSTN